MKVVDQVAKLLSLTQAENGLKPQKKMLLTYRKGGDMAKSKFDMSLLKPIQSAWDESKLKPLEEDEEEIPYEAPPPRQGLSGIWEDVKDIPGKVLDYGLDLPGKATESWEQIFTHPSRALKNLIAGAGETVEAPINLLGAVGPYLKERGITNKIPGFQVPDTGIEKAMGLDEQQPGDELIRQMFMFAPVPHIAGKIPGVGKVSQRVKGMAEHGPLTRRAEELETKHGEATKEHGAATDEYNALKNFLESQPGFESSNPHALKRKAAEAEQKLAQLREQTEAVPEHLRATEEPVAPEKTPLSLVEPIRAGEKPEISEEPIRQAESLFKTNAQKSAEQEAKISQHLGEGNAHRKRVAEKLNPILEARQAEIGQGYDNYLEGLKGKQVTLSNPRDAKAITADIQKHLKLGDTSSKEMVKLSDELANLGKGETMPADKFVSAYRSLRGMAQKTRSSAYGKSPQEFDRLIEAADSMDADVAKMAKIIDHGMGEENLEELHKLNHRYATEVAPLFKNKFFQHMQANNKAPTNMIEQLTNEPYIKSTNPNKITGTQILNEIIKSDPELLQNVVGERFAHKPEALHQWDEAAHSFIQHMPELQELRGQHFEAKQAEAQSKLDLERAKQEHQMQREQADIAHRKATQEAAEQTRTKKSEVHKENQAKQKEHEVKSKHYKMQQEMKSLEEKSTKLKDSATKLHEKSKRKDMSLKQKLDIEHELAQTKKQIAKIDKDIKLKRRALKAAGAIAVTGILGGPIYDKAKSLIGGS